MAKEWLPKPSKPSPDMSTGVVGWLKINLFSSPGNSFLTLLGLAILLMTVPPFLRWAVIDASWLGDSRGVCDAASAGGQAGACWVFIKVRLGVFLYGFYPEPERWRINLTVIVLAVNVVPILSPVFFKSPVRQAVLGMAGVAGVSLGYGFASPIFMALYFFLPFALAWLSERRAAAHLPGGGPAVFVSGLAATLLGASAAYLVIYYLLAEQLATISALFVGLICLLLLFVRRLSIMGWRWILLFSLYPVFCFYMLVGGVFGLAHVETHYWGGLFLTLVVAGTGMATALPIGILLALGRRSELPVIRTVCVSFIEFVRGVPLVSVLFMASVMFPLFLPENVTFDKLLRALVGIAFFYAAYMAEVIRGGLQGIPRGQYEAAKALGWAYWRMMSVIILPQTLRLVIPGLANNFLSLLKDTTLVAVIGLLDLLGIAKAAMADSEWLGFTKEAYVFAAIVFWVFCFGISRYSVHLEKKYHTSYH